MVARTILSRSAGLTSLQAAIWFMYSPSVKMMFCPSACWPTLQSVNEYQMINYALFWFCFFLCCNTRSLLALYLAWWRSRQVPGSRGWSWWPTWCGYWCPDTTSSPEDITAMLFFFASNPLFQFDLIIPHIWTAPHLSKAQPRPLLLSVPDARGGVVHVALWGTDRTLQGNINLCCHGNRCHTHS